MEQNDAASGIPEISPTEGMVDISKAQDGGLYKQILVEGAGGRRPGTGNKVEVHYVGRLLSGDKFDSSRDRNDPFVFTLGKGQVIKGWDEGVATMAIGEIAILTCRSDYAYGASGSPPTIPPNSILKFEVELISFKGDDVTDKKDGGVMKSTLRDAPNREDDDTPRMGAQVKVKIIGYYNDQAFDTRELSFILGEGSQHNIPWGVDLAISSMKVDERCRVVIKPEYGFREAGNPEFKIPANAELDYEIELISMENAKENWEMSTEEKVQQAIIVKEKGTGFLKKGSLEAAYSHYLRVIKYLEDESLEGVTGDKLADYNKTLLAGYLNCAHCELKFSDHPAVLEHCNKALDIDKDNEKAHFRRGEAYFALQDYEIAKKDYDAALRANPSNKQAIRKAAQCQQHITKEKNRQKSLYGGMFEKFAKKEEQAEAVKKAVVDEKPDVNEAETAINDEAVTTSE
ncbi:unnamed protein product [Owenia fusiformis]|uniref:peptidylprolyl isomerase n=1 Tax=Owenia fusiformis TaxID=6347 RepID=A0A8J1Y3K5_OWEFU|nr:unnamed protein product [Owenia fusiformis]